MNIFKVLHALNVDLYTHVVNNKEADDIFRAFFLAGVAEIEASTDLGYAYLLRQVAAKYGIHHILEGHSFVAEGITPLGYNYFDGRYIQSIHRRFGRLPMATFPLMTFTRFLKSVIVGRVKFIRPFWYLDHSKEEAQDFLKRTFGWQYYGGHHLENRMTSFYHSVYLPQKFNSDMRNNTLSARARNGTLSRADAWAEYNTLYFDILSAYHELTGLPTLVNTSFNNHEEPIVCTPEDALRSLFLDNVDYVILGHRVVRRVSG